MSEANDILTEFNFTARWMRIEGYHRVGSLLLENDFPPAKLEKFAYSLNIDPYALATAVLLAKQYPDLNTLPAGKDISWNTIRDYLDEET